MEPDEPTDPAPAGIRGGTWPRRAQTRPLRSLAVLAALLLPLTGQREPSVIERITGRDFPSVFQAWNPAEAPGSEDLLLARHDLVFAGPSFFGLRRVPGSPGLTHEFTPESVVRARTRRRRILARNPRTLLLAEVRYRDASESFYPRDHEFWMRDTKGRRVTGWKEGGFYRIDFRCPRFLPHLVSRVRTLMTTGVVDGIFLDWWREDDDRVRLVAALRKAIGHDALILVNANDRPVPRSARHVNGLFMECYRTREPEDWQRIERTLRWAESHLQQPTINCLETWFHESRQDLSLMRAATTLSLCHSNGYCLFSDPNPLPTPDHRHAWYPFWDAPLGRPRGRARRSADGAWHRVFGNGDVVYNGPANEEVTVRFGEARRSVATGRVATEHRVAPRDGDVFLRVAR